MDRAKFLGITKEKDIGKAVPHNFSVSGSFDLTGEGRRIIRKLSSRLVRIELDTPIPKDVCKKGDTVDIIVGDEKYRGTLYHIRKPYKDSEARIYFIRIPICNIIK